MSAPKLGPPLLRPQLELELAQFGSLLAKTCWLAESKLAGIALAAEKSN